MGEIKLAISFLFLSLIFSFSISKDGNYKIVYAYTEEFPISAVKADDSLEMVMIDAYGETTRKKMINKTKWNKNSFPKFSIQIIAEGNNSSSVLTFQENGISRDIRTNVDFPDKIVFDKNGWHTYKEKKVRELPDIKITSSATDSFKTILGYRCRKFNVKESVSGQHFYAWICKDLPATLMPCGGYQPLPGAVLEMVYPERNARFIATSITKL